MHDDFWAHLGTVRCTGVIAHKYLSSVTLPSCKLLFPSLIDCLHCSSLSSLPVPTPPSSFPSSSSSFPPPLLPSPLPHPPSPLPHPPYPLPLPQAELSGVQEKSFHLVSRHLVKEVISPNENVRKQVRAAVSLSWCPSYSRNTCFHILTVMYIRS